jgi:hypothetical protein
MHRMPRWPPAGTTTSDDDTVSSVVVVQLQSISGTPKTDTTKDMSSPAGTTTCTNALNVQADESWTFADIDQSLSSGQHKSMAWKLATLVRMPPRMPDC